MFQDTSHPDNRALFIDLIEGLFHIALADDILHEGEEVFLAHVAEIFGLDARCFRAIRARLVEGAARDPYDVLGVSHEASIETVRAAWRAAVKENHPDALIARGVPREAAVLAEHRMIAINDAWAQIQGKKAA
jgi:DnaJ like chaperone protein